MTMTYDPFTPAGGPEQRRYDGRRRAGDPGEGGRRSETHPEWADGPHRREATGWAGPAPVSWEEPPGVAGDEPTRAGWDEPVRAGWDEPVRAGRDEPVRARWDEPGAATWDEPRAQQQGWVEDPRAADGWEQRHPQQQRHPEQQPRWPAGPAESFPGGRGAEAGTPVTKDRGRRGRLVVIGLVVLLVVVAGWQAYRIEGMSQHNADLASVLTAEKGRTDRLEKQLAGVFDPEGVSSSVLPSVFRVRAGELTGTAFSVGNKAPDGRSNLFTNYHVVASVWNSGGKRVSLERGATRITATIVKVDKGKDLALLTAGQRIAGLSMAGGEVKPGQQVVVVGAPLGLDDSVTTGVISAYRPDDRDGPTIQFDAPINPGNSGGPVVNSSKRVVGVATAKAKDAEGIGLAIPIKRACDTFAVC